MNHHQAEVVFQIMVLLTTRAVTVKNPEYIITYFNPEMLVAPSI